MSRRTLFHVSARVNRDSIRTHGLDPRRMGAARGIAGSERPELDGVFVCHARDEAMWFVEMGGRQVGAVDLWEIDDPGSVLKTTGSGFDYLPLTVPPERLRLVESFAAPPPEVPTPAGNGSLNHYLFIPAGEEMPEWPRYDFPVPESVIAEVFDPPQVAYGDTWDDEDDVLVARDRCGPRAAIAVLGAQRPAGRWWECMVYVDSGEQWTVEAQQGDLWPLDPAAPRPAGDGFAHLTAAVPHRRADRAGDCVLRGGVAAAGVATVEVVTAVERHRVEIHAGSGAFVALAPLGEDATVELVARAADGSVLERVAAKIGERDWPRQGEWPPEPLPEWLRGPLEAVVGDFARSGGAPVGLDLGYTPNGSGGVVWVTHRLPDRWGFGIDALERGPELLLRLADELQECWHELPDVRGFRLPACPHHVGHAAVAVLGEDGEAWWVCPADRRPLARVGSYDH